MEFIIFIAFILGIAFSILVWIDFALNQNDDATTVGQFKKFQDAFLKGEK